MCALGLHHAVATGMLRFIPFVVLAGCWFPEGDDGYEPDPPVCGDGVQDREECDDGNTVDGDTCSSTCQKVQQYTVHWRTSSVSSGSHSCPAGFDTANVIVEPIVAPDDCYPTLDDCAYTSNGPEVTFAAPCLDGAKRVQLPPLRGTHEAYRVAVAFENSASGEVYGETLPSVLREVTELVMYEDQGFVRAAWNFVSTTWGPLDCFNANVPDVTIKVIESDGGVAGMTTVPCMKLSAYSPPIVHGVYTVDVITSQGSATVPNVTVDDRSGLTDLGTVTVRVP